VFETRRGQSAFEGLLIDWVVAQPVSEPRLPVSLLSREDKAAELQRVQARRAKLAAYEAEQVMGLADDSPDTLDPPAGAPGARRGSWRSEAELPGVSEFFVPELAHVLNCGRMSANLLAVRAWLWRESLPATRAAMAAGDLDEPRAKALADVLAQADPAVAREIEALLLPDAVNLTIGKLKARALALLLERDAAAIDDRRTAARKAADVRAHPSPREGMAAFAAELPAPVSAACWDAVDRYAALLKADGDLPPIGELRAAVLADLILRPWDESRPAVTAQLQITADLAALAGRSTVAGEVSGLPITAAHLRALLAELDALGVRAPEGGSLAFGLTDPDGTLRATVDADRLRGLVRRGCADHPAADSDGGCGCPVLDRPPATDAYAPTAAQRAFVKLRDRTCRMPNCGQRVGWADLDHVIPHACGGDTECTNLCCLCRSHHRLKTFARGWRFAMDPDGTLHVTSPSGITRTTRPPGLHRTDVEPPSAAEAGNSTAAALPDNDPPPF
jgi:hypothetical protein